MPIGEAMRTSPAYAVPLLFGPPGRPSVLVVRTILFTAVVTAVATLVASSDARPEVGLLLVGAMVLLLLSWTRIAVRRAHGCEERLARAEDRDGETDANVRRLTDRFQTLLLEYEEQRERAEAQRAELNGTVRERTAELMAANRKLERIDQMKDEFVSLLAHELRTPLTSVRTYVELLLEYEEQGVDGSERREFLEIVRDQTRRVSRLILEILDVSRLRAGRFELTIGDHDVVRAVEEAIEGDAEDGDERHPSKPRVVLRAPSEALSVRCDRARVIQVLRTLLGNAVDHAKGAAPVEVEFATDGDRVTVAVEDHGEGVPPAERESIFEPFHRTRRDGHSTDSGTGLGIFLGRELARKMGGDLWVEDAPGGGARFVLALPNAVPSPARPEPAETAASPAGA